jgi:membrane protein implicated in regulation of membrane protease activity
MEALTNNWAGFGALTWLGIGAALLAAELLTGTAYLLWIATAAALTAALAAIFPEASLPLQMVAFALFALATTVAGRSFFRPDTTPSEDPNLNSPLQRHIGQTSVAVDNFVGGMGRVRLGDTEWAAKTYDGAEPASGSVLVVTGVEGAVLHVTRAN